MEAIYKAATMAKTPTMKAMVEPEMVEALLGIDPLLPEPEDELGPLALGVGVVTEVPLLPVG
jgi:hypothetical protein